MQRYQWLLFDADGTLFDFERAEVTAFEQAFGLMGVKFEPSYLATYQRINQTLWQAVESGEIKPAVVKLRRFEILLEAIGVDISAVKLSDAYVECLAARAELIEDANEVLQALHGKYRIAILTNGLQAVQRGRLARSVIRDHIADIIISEEIGFVKPAREFFDIALARIGNPSIREVLMIGDSWTSDIQGAVQSGIDACWYNPNKKPRPTSLEITREITSLRELVTWLKAT